MTQALDRKQRREVKRVKDKFNLNSWKGAHPYLTSYSDAIRYSKSNPTEQIFGVYFRSAFFLDYNDNKTQKNKLEEFGVGKPGKGHLVNGKLTRTDKSNSNELLTDAYYFIPTKDEESALDLENRIHSYLKHQNRKSQTEQKGRTSGDEWFDGFSKSVYQAVEEFISIAREVTQDKIIGYATYTPEYFQDELSKTLLTFYVDLFVNKNKKGLSRKLKTFYTLMKPRSGKNSSTFLGLSRIWKFRYERGITTPLVVDYLSFWPSAFKGATEDCDVFKYEDDITLNYVNTNNEGWEGEYQSLLNSPDTKIIVRFSSMQSLDASIAKEYNNSEESEGDDIVFDKNKLTYFIENPAHIGLLDEGDHGMRTTNSQTILKSLSHYEMIDSLSGSDFYALRNEVGKNENGVSNYFAYDIIEEDIALKENRINRKIPRTRTHTLKPSLLPNEEHISVEEMSMYGLCRRVEKILETDSNKSKDVKWDKDSQRFVDSKTNEPVKFKYLTDASSYIQKTYHWDWSPVAYTSKVPKDHNHIYWTMPNKLSVFALFNHVKDGDISFDNREIIVLNHPKYSNPFTMEEKVNETIESNNKTITFTVGKMLRGGKAPWSATVRMDTFTDSRVGLQIGLRAQNSKGEFCDIYDANIWRVSQMRVDIIKNSSNGTNESQVQTKIEKNRLIPIFCQGDKSDSMYEVKEMTATEVDSYWIQNDILKSFENTSYFNFTDENVNILNSLNGEVTSAPKIDKRAGKVNTTTRQGNVSKNEEESKKDTNWKKVFKTISRYLPALIYLEPKNDIQEIFDSINDDVFSEWMHHTGNPINPSEVSQWKEVILNLFDREEINKKIRATLTYIKENGISERDIQSMARRNQGDVPVPADIARNIIEEIYPADGKFYSMYDMHCGMGSQSSYYWKEKLVSLGCENPENYIYINDYTDKEWESLNRFNLEISLKRLGSSFSFKNIIKPNKMNPDFIIINPPYKGDTHIEIFNKSFEELNDGGTLICLHPATPFINRKEVSRSPATQRINEIVSEYLSKLTLINGNDIFDIAQESPLCITKVKKEKNKNIEVINNYYTNSNDINIYESLDDVFIHGNSIVKSIKEKLENLIHISIEENLYRKTKKYKNYLLKINAISTGTPKNGKPSGKFQSIISKKYENSFEDILFTNETTKNSSNEIVFDSVLEAKNCFNYLLTKFARFAVSIYKINQNLHRGELKAVPYMDFSQEWTDEKLFDYFQLTQEERDFINTYIQNWYERDFN
jgi:5S rRNA maturation endonuclease (ribonuclease M5)